MDKSGQGKQRHRHRWAPPALLGVLVSAMLLALPALAGPPGDLLTI